MNSQTDARTLALAYIEAVGSKQFDRVAEFLDPDVELMTAGPSIHGALNYVAALRRLAPIIVRNDIKATIVDGNDVAVFYDFVTDTPAGAVPTVEWLSTSGDRIRSSRLIFEKENWPLAVAELARRIASAT